MSRKASDEIANRVREIITENLGCDEDEVTDNASLIDDLGADSLDVVELVMSLEQEYELEISDEDAENIVTVKQAIDYVMKHK